MKNDALIQVPVAVNVFIRPEMLKKVFEVVKQARPSVLFLVGDGPRDGNKEDVLKIAQSREVVEDVDWECDVHRLYPDKNQGMYATYFNAQKYIFERVDRCIFLEDDVLVSKSFFKFCEVLLEKYKDDLRVHYITGHNYLGKYVEPDSDYFFSGEGSIWGYAIWKRTYLSQNLEYTKNQYVTSRIEHVAKQLKPGYEKLIRGYKNDMQYGGHVAGPEFYKNLLRFSQNQVCIVPTKNMVSNIGVGEGSVHSSTEINFLPKSIGKLFLMVTYEYTFPLKDPVFVVRDRYYEDYVNRILAWNKPIIQTYRRLEAAARLLLYGRLGEFTRKIKKYIKHESEK